MFSYETVISISKSAPHQIIKDQTSVSSMHRL
jgi:hypothetical protein